ncbi:uncharacterized protein LOC110612637 [Manihot esculenta]|uniref:uncharacterized protein LOC110612637 n=1 Tax=Manihot esculenta TaxID=3983 RepID=UPI000B5D10EE|nr:uncharacterized protein LOC110612637 [Manihot esculenta]
MKEFRGSLLLADVNCFTEGKNHFNALLSDQEVRWKQRTKVFWLKEGDKNTKIFHSAASNRHKNSIVRLRDASGDWMEDKEALGGLISRYFADIFTFTAGDVEPVVEHILNCVSATDNDLLTMPYTLDEISEAIFSMHPEKALVQQTLLVLIPKKNTPESMSDLRPIALCNVIYKIMSKAIAIRLKKVLPFIISTSQNAFVHTRSMQDNNIVVFELMHFFLNKRKGKEGFDALKIDISKAYDRLEWNYISVVLSKMGFDQHWITNCISTMNYWVLHAGQHLGPIIPSRGVRQLLPLKMISFPSKLSIFAAN